MWKWMSLVITHFTDGYHNGYKLENSGGFGLKIDVKLRSLANLLLNSTACMTELSVGFRRFHGPCPKKLLAIN